ncbi:hypothetical protein SNEBB_002041 [Seison nebaliae]|nr:hypothetical protein SNEBB_002041 [Seison nebaliae]
MYTTELDEKTISSLLDYSNTNSDYSLSTTLYSSNTTTPTCGLSTSFQYELIEAGCDEAGRGCLAGPVFAAAVILPKHFQNDLIRDSKKLSERNRWKARKIIEGEAISYATGISFEEEIDDKNILRASISAMHKAVKKLSVKPQFLTIDGNKFEKCDDIPHICVIGGDNKYLNIASASILAKTNRDEYMKIQHYFFPEYKFNENKGYGTLRHRRSIEEIGNSPIHRKSFKLKHKKVKLKKPRTIQ